MLSTLPLTPFEGCYAVSAASPRAIL